MKALLINYLMHITVLAIVCIFVSADFLWLIDISSESIDKRLAMVIATLFSSTIHTIYNICKEEYKEI